jgi:protein-arginine kinase activator protein McsA
MNAKALNEGDEGQENYMFFGNLQQIQRQCEMLLRINPDELDSIIKDGHDWAADHVSEAKNNMDQVFDFLMNEIQENKSEMKAKLLIDQLVVKDAKNERAAKLRDEIEQLEKEFDRCDDLNQPTIHITKSLQKLRAELARIKNHS